MRFLILALALVSGAARADFYIEGALSAILRERPHVTQEYEACIPFNTLNGVIQCRPGKVPYRALYTDEINDVTNPYGDLVIGYDWEFKRFTIDAQLIHQSAIAAKDRGRESFRVSVRWYPLH